LQYEIEQPSLFSAHDSAGFYSVAPREHLEMSPIALQDWKQTVLAYQQQVPITAGAHQPNLFANPAPEFAVGTAIGSCIITDPEQLNPFTLPQQNTQFWRWRAEDAGVPALYFVIDYAAEILLYIGETIKSNQRWNMVASAISFTINKPITTIIYPHNLALPFGKMHHQQHDRDRKWNCN
jgi:hypothetical protein